MAFKRDYVLRVIEQMGEFVRKLAQLLDDKQRWAMLDQASRDHCGLSLDAALALSPETLAQLLPPQALLILSEHLYLAGETLTRNEEKRQAMLLHTLRLLCSLYEEETLCVERSMRLKELMESCEERLTAADYLNCARFFLAGEHFDFAEDAIFLAVELGGAAWAEPGRALLEQMLSLPESVLVPGGMTREDVVRAIDDLKKCEQR